MSYLRYINYPEALSKTPVKWQKVFAGYSSVYAHHMGNPDDILVIFSFQTDFLIKPLFIGGNSKALLELYLMSYWNTRYAVEIVQLVFDIDVLTNLGFVKTPQDTYLLDKRQAENFKDKFDAFYFNNVDSVRNYTMSIPPHPIDREMLYQWRINMKYGVSHRIKYGSTQNALNTFVDEFYYSIRHVPIAEFLERLEKMTLDMDAFLRERNFTHVCLVILDNFKKSNLWVTMLAYRYIMHHVTHVVFLDDTSDDANLAFTAEELGENCVAIMFDDAAYSGQQYVDYLRRIIQALPNNVTCCVGIPYISEEAKELIKQSNLSALWFSNASESFHQLREFDAFTVHPVDFTLVDEYFNNVGIIPNKHVLYFDHKLADHVSIYHAIMAFGIYIDAKDGFGTLPLIKNCEEVWKPFVKENTLSDILATSDIPYCPSPPYKSFAYTFTRKQAPFAEFSTHLHRILMLKNQMCFGCVQMAAQYQEENQGKFFCGPKCQKKHYKK